MASIGPNPYSFTGGGPCSHQSIETVKSALKQSTAHMNVRPERTAATHSADQKKKTLKPHGSIARGIKKGLTSAISPNPIAIFEPESLNSRCGIADLAGDCWHGKPMSANGAKAVIPNKAVLQAAALSQALRLSCLSRAQAGAGAQGVSVTFGSFGAASRSHGHREHWDDTSLPSTCAAVSLGPAETATSCRAAAGSDHPAQSAAASPRMRPCPDRWARTAL